MALYIPHRTETGVSLVTTIPIGLVPIAPITISIAKFLMTIVKSSSDADDSLIALIFVISMLAYASARLVLNLYSKLDLSTSAYVHHRRLDQGLSLRFIMSYRVKILSRSPFFGTSTSTYLVKWNDTSVEIEGVILFDFNVYNKYVSPQLKCDKEIL